MARTSCGKLSSPGSGYRFWWFLQTFPKLSTGTSCEHSYFAWKELSPAALRALISPGRFDRSEVWRHRHDHVFDRDRDLSNDHRLHSWFLDHEPAFYVHTSILSGSLERDLRQACEILTAQVVGHKQGLAQAISEQTQRWLSERSDKEG